MKSAIVSLLTGLLGVGLAAAGPVGKVLILDNELLIEGEIRQEGDRYIIRRGMGETIIPASKVIELVADRQQAYRVMSDRCNRHDFDERTRLLYWCMENSLRDEALAEAESLLKFRPADEKIQRLVQDLRAVKAPPAPVPPASSAAPSDKVFEVETPDYNRESFGTFVSKVQPILMNACASCHSAGQGGNFTLINVIGGSTPKASLFNLTSTLKQLTRTDLANSPLLVKAVAAHGQGVRPPLRDQHAPAYQNLEAWVQMAVVPEVPDPRQQSVTIARPDVVAEAKPALPTSFGDTIAKPTVAAAIKPAQKTAFGETSTSQTRPEPQTEPKDPFDPAIFNGVIQPKK
jgi:hypothetical protein